MKLTRRRSLLWPVNLAAPSYTMLVLPRMNMPIYLVSKLVMMKKVVTEEREEAAEVASEVVVVATEVAAAVTEVAIEVLATVVEARNSPTTKMPSQLYEQVQAIK